MSRSRRAAVSNSSPLILFPAIGRLDLLSGVFAEVLIPPAVWDEVVECGTNQPGAREVESAEWIRVIQISQTWDPRQQTGRIHRGEWEAISLAAELKHEYPILLDDQRARHYALARGLEVIGSAGMLIRMKRQGLIPVVRPLLDQLQHAGLYPSEGLYNELLDRADERQVD